MKAAITVALLLGLFACGAQARAKPAPIEGRLVTASLDDTTIDSGPSGAMFESNYFNAPQAPFTAVRLFPCRLQVRIFDKTRLAQACN
jgi:hypothetical protein